MNYVVGVIAIAMAVVLTFLITTVHTCEMEHVNDKQGSYQCFRDSVSDLNIDIE